MFYFVFCRWLSLNKNKKINKNKNKKINKNNSIYIMSVIVLLDIYN